MVARMTEYIDRDYVLKLLGVFNDRVHGDYHFMNGIKTAKEIVVDAPSADVQPVKHGRWIFNKPPNNWAEMRLSPKNFYVCDICGHIVDDISNYCPGCGAVMDGGDF